MDDYFSSSMANMELNHTPCNAHEPENSGIKDDNPEDSQSGIENPL